MAEGCAASCAKVILVILNILFMIFGLTLLIIGVVFLVNVDFLTSEITPLLKTIEFSGISMAGLVNNLSILFIVLGGIVLFIAMMGLVGACCEVSCCLVVYAAILIILFIVQLVVVILWAVLQMQIEDKLKSELKSKILQEYKSDELDSSSQLSNSWNYIFITLDCCGVDDQSQTNYDFTQTDWCSTVNCTQQKVLPRTCCKGVTKDNYKKATCTRTFTDYNEKGCVNEMKAKINAYSPWFIAFGVLILVVELLCAMFAICVCRRKTTEKIA